MNESSHKPRAGMTVSERVRLLRPLGSGGMADVWVADHLTLGTQVAVKFMRATHDPQMRERFAREAQLAAKIDHPHAVRIFDHGHTAAGTPFMVMELIEGESLAHRIRRAGAMRADDVDRVVDQVAQVLVDAHGHGILHRDIKPHNIMLLANTEQLFCKVLDFGLAKPLSEPEDMTLTQAGFLMGTPAYMAPEQLIDAKPATPLSDVWSLAVVAYECLTGKRPFPGQHRAAMGVAMLLQRFEPPSATRPELPAALDGFFEKAFAVEPAERHPDVKSFAQALHETLAGAVSGTRSPAAAADRFELPARLYGRDAELAQLDEAYGKVAAGDARLMLLAGYAGVGKTALVEEARRRFADRGAVFVGGKFDQFQRGTPYDSLVQAFRELVRFIGGQDEASIAGWRARLNGALGEVGHVLTDVLPELEDVIGPQPTLGDASPTEARHRFHNAVARFLHGVATPERPLVLFLDDLQWADLPSIDLLTHLASDPAGAHLLVLGAYRDNEIDASHPFTDALAKLHQLGAPPDEIRLGPLGEDAVLELLTDVLGNVPGRVRFAVLCHEKTQGNPFFLRRFLEALHEDHLLRWDPASESWTWDQTRILSRPLGDDVVDFIAAEMGRLPERPRKALATAACIGGHFDLGTLAFLLELDRRQALEALRESLAAEFVVPASDQSWRGGEVGAQRIAFRFAHDRIRQAARTLFADAEAARVHERVGQFMLEHLDANEREARLFELVEHLNKSAEMQPARVVDAARLRALNLSAARRAARSAAFEPAEDYYKEARALLDGDVWEEDYEQALAIHVEGARSAYLNGDREAMDALIDAAVFHARHVLDAVEAREVKIQALIAEQRFAEAVELALQVLGEIGVELPPEPSPVDVEQAVGAALEALKATSREAIVALPLAEAREERATQRITQGVMSAAYLSKPNLLPLLASHIVRSTLAHGVTVQSAYGFAVFGMVMNAVGAIDVSYENGKVALALLERVDDRAHFAKTQHIVRAHLNPFVEPIGESVEHLRGVFQLGMDTGDLEYAAWALHIMVAHAFYAGRALGELNELFERNRDVMARHEQLPALGCTLPYGQLVANLLGRAEDRTRLVSEGYDEGAQMAALVEVGFRGAAYILTVARTFLRFLMRDVSGAREAAAEGEEYADGASASYHPVWFHQYRALAELGAVGGGDDESGTDALAADAIATARADLERLTACARFSEANHAHRVALVEAELARVEGRDGDALGHYDAAIEAAREHGFLHEEALANELAARFYLGRGSTTPARAYLREAREAYSDWGASAKVAQLEEELGELLARGRRR
ncbi:MAG TPA: serine/threonine-protein kinase PknK [Polyangiaceae bacterium LLY-WYZ-15_(1-7)]|nr:serine/threonine-protein kinase PknK [Polyangiaceae bacterium LLY-WYZ-15_(1-7)]HJL07246.1 serine/threonine-protein kinase PknK [Polyangiaceae bacterium LLY-WYZ-15_(1-7)]